MRCNALIFLVVVQLSFQSCNSINKSSVFEVDNVAMGGYDPVAFVMDQEALNGKQENKVNYLGVDYYFIRPSYRDEFLRNPDKYIPAYGGYCGYNVAINSKRVDPDPTLWILQEGKLILFSDDEALNGKNKTAWVVKRHLMKQNADSNWASMN